MKSTMLQRSLHRWPSVLLKAAALLILLGSAGCGAKAQARTPTDRPPLDAPPPPPRVIAPAPVETSAESGEKAVAGAPAGSTTRPPSTTRPAGGTSPRVEGKPEPPKPEAVPEKVETPVERRPEPAVGLLQTTPPGNEAEADKNIRTLLAAAGQTLGRVDYRALKPDARTQYNTAKRLMQQAEDALKAKNFAFALKLADKAAELARSLPGR